MENDSEKKKIWAPSSLQSHSGGKNPAKMLASDRGLVLAPPSICLPWYIKLIVHVSRDTLWLITIYGWDTLLKETQDKEIMHRINNEVVSFGMAIASRF